MSVTFHPAHVHPTGHNLTLWCNLHNANAADILGRLGYPATTTGEVNAAEFAERIDLALLGLDVDAAADAAVAATVDGRWHTGGRPANYLTDTLTRLAAVADAGVADDQPITWA